MNDSPGPRSVIPRQESTLLALVSAVQFVNILDFMMVMPLGPDFAAGLQIPTSNLGLIGGSYTASAAVAGLLFSPFLDRFGRRQALVLSMCGLAVATALGGAATGFYTLVGARVLAGMFGGPATSLALSIVADSVPPERRGRALGIVMGAFAAASVLGVPAGLELATLWGWRAPFLAVGALGALVTVFVGRKLPPMRGHLERTTSAGPLSTRELLSRPLVRWSLSMTAVAMIGAFALIPNLAAFIQFNRGFSREHLGSLYLIGGIVAFFSTRISGRLADKVGATRVAIFGTLLFVAVNVLGVATQYMPVTAMFIGFMVSNSSRMVPMNALTSRVPAPHERARFLSLQSAVQHISSASGAMLSAQVLTTGPSGALIGIPRIAYVSALLAGVLPFLISAVEKRVRSLEASRA